MQKFHIIYKKISEDFTEKLVIDINSYAVLSSPSAGNYVYKLRYIFRKPLFEGKIFTRCASLKGRVDKSEIVACLCFDIMLREIG